MARERIAIGRQAFEEAGAGPAPQHDAGTSGIIPPEQPRNLTAAAEDIAGHESQQKNLRIADMIAAPWSSLKKIGTGLKNYVMEAPHDDTRSVSGKIRDGAVAVLFSPTVAFNAANLAFSVSNNNQLAAILSGAVGALSVVTTVLDDWKNRASSSSYRVNAAYQGALGLTYLPRLAAGDLGSLKDIALYGLATTGHSLRAWEEEEARHEGVSMDEYYKAFPRGAAKYSQSYYGATEFIAVNAGQDPNMLASGIAFTGIMRALNDQKFWDLKGPLKPLRQLTAPRIFTAGYAASFAAAVASGDYWFAASQAGWGWGNANFDFLGPKVKKAIKRRYANDPAAAQQALENLEEANVLAHEMQDETKNLMQDIKTQNWEAAADKLISLYHRSDTDVRRDMYLGVLQEMAPASLYIRNELKKLGVAWEDKRSAALLGAEGAAPEPLLQ